MSEIYMMVTICNRKQMQKFVKFYKQNHVDTGNISLAMGTAASDVLDYFGLEEDEKGIHFCLVTRPTWKTVKKGLQTELKIDVPGTGIVFLIPLSSIGGKHQLKFMLGEQEFEKGEETTLKETKHELIIAIANYGYNTQVMRAAEEGGATGGTVFHGKGVGMKRAEQFLGVSLVSEKEIILIVTKTEQKNAIMKSIMEKVDKGEFEVGETVKVAYVDQQHKDIDPNKTVYQVISGGNDLIRMGNRDVNARAYLSRFNFSGSDQEKLCGMLSGGERNRLHLAMALKEEGNVLLLDEPTNDIDVNTLRALEEGLEDFAGCAVVISHDRWFLDRICTHILAFEGNSEVFFFEGSYTEYEENKMKRMGNVEPKRVRYRKLMED